MKGEEGSFTRDELLSLLRARLSPMDDAPRFLGSDHASVVILLTLRTGSPEVLFAKRAENPNDPWSGQIAFPGGRSKEVDATLARTACREFFEETYVDICKRAEMLGFLQTVRPRNRPSVTVTPFVAYSDRKFVFTPSREVTEVFWAPLLGLTEKPVDVEVSGAVLRGVPAFVYEGHVVWGLTAHIVRSLLDLLSLS
ncbi:MAG TPA: CoA pyrophosphatase [Conexivisphaerales archaeon]|nr:CoA pyrophosphatase [Conexivisphaerales archaeon]